MQIPFNRPYLTGNELKYMEEAIRSIGDGGHISGDGKFTKKAGDFMQSRFGAEKVLLTPSGTSALELATHLLNLKHGDEVIVPSFTFSSTVNPVVMAGARPVFADISPDTQNIDPEDIRRKITPRTRAIYPVHYAGVSCPMDEIMEMAADHDLKVVEDAAHGVNARYRGRYLGTIGDFGCYSFHETKNYVCGEGGALLINTKDPGIIERAEIIREKGTNRSKFYRGEVDKYTWVDIGSSCLLSDLLAAFLCAQLEEIDLIQQMRLELWNTYYTVLQRFQEKGLIRLPVIPDYADHNAHLFYILLRDGAARDRTMKYLKDHGVYSVFHYIPLHSAPFGRQLGYRKEDLPVTEDTSSRLLRLPMYAGMSPEESGTLNKVLKKFGECT